MASVTRWSWIKDCVGAVLFMIMCGFFYRELVGAPPKATWYPKILLFLILAFSMFLLTKSVVGLMRPPSGAPVPAPDAESVADAGGEPVKFGFATAFVIVLSFLYVLVMPWIGFTLSSVVMLIVFMLAMGVRSILVLVLVPAVEVSFLLYVFESLLTVFLPDARPLLEMLGWG